MGQTREEKSLYFLVIIRDLTYSIPGANTREGFQVVATKTRPSESKRSADDPEDFGVTDRGRYREVSSVSGLERQETFRAPWVTGPPVTPFVTSREWRHSFCLFLSLSFLLLIYVINSGWPGGSASNRILRRLPGSPEATFLRPEYFAGLLFPVLCAGRFGHVVRTSTTGTE